MNLTTSYPASPKQELFGVVQIQRAIDKAKAKAHGEIGEYHYNCPMDRMVFEFLGVDHEQLLEQVSTGTDIDAKEYLRPIVERKDAAAIAAFNAKLLAMGPEPGTDGARYFEELRGRVAPDRTDVTAWADLLDLDEKRSVPPRVAA